MVSLVQLVEHQIVVLGVMGSSPIGYPKKREKQLLLSLFGYGAGWRLLSLSTPCRWATSPFQGAGWCLLSLLTPVSIR